jgi:metacaspase-1
LRERLQELINQELSQDADSLVKKANEKIHKISARLKNKLESLKTFNDTIQQIIDLVAITDLLVDFRSTKSKEAWAETIFSTAQPVRAVFTIDLRDSTGLLAGNVSLFDHKGEQVFLSDDRPNASRIEKKIAKKQSKTKGISIHIGLNRIDPAHYQGWKGELNGCENDAKSMQAIADQQEFESQLILTQKATANQVKQALIDAAEQLESGDILLLTYSGHGGQIPDLNNDEDDKLDETWVLYDREFIDDELYALFGSFKTGVRIFVLSDSCHSGTVTKSRVYKNLLELESSKDDFQAKSYKTPEMLKIKAMPSEFRDKTHVINQRLYRKLQKENPQVDSQDIAASIILISGCQDNQLSMDGNTNGFFTQTLLEIWQAGKFQGSYRQFRREIGSLMPPYQSPHFYTAGTPNPDFENQTPFTIN